LKKRFFWHKASEVPMTERQTQVLNLFLDGYEAKITSKTWATLAKCSKDTAIRDIQDLVDKNILKEDIPGAKRPSYSIVYDAEDLTQFFTEVNITEENGIQYLKAMFKGKKPICERVLKLDADRYQKGDLPLSNLLSKYCSYIVAGNREKKTDISNLETNYCQTRYDKYIIANRRCVCSPRKRDREVVCISDCANR
jgi:hypothetical protein